MNRTFNFLKQLGENNNKEWFQANRLKYEGMLAEMHVLADSVLGHLSKTDLIETPSGKKSLYRIYRDLRFSKDKTPYSNYMGGRFRRSGADRRGGYYYHIEPGNTHVVAGFWNPNPDDLKMIREHIVADPEHYKTVIENPEFVKLFGKVRGQQLVNAPKGFEKEDPNVDFIRNKQFLLYYYFEDSQVLHPDFPILAANIFIKMRPWLDVMTEYLTTDLNGISLI